MLVLLPLITVILSILCFSAFGYPIRKACIISAILFGLIVALSTEIFSFFTIINKTSIAALWTILDIALSVYILNGRRYKLFKFSKPTNLTPFWYVCIFGVIAILFVTFLIAIISPPNNWDSMAYHMGRVVHWIQNGSVAHYPTNITRELYNPPWAEYAIMHLQILSDGDRFANMVQWVSMAGSIIGVTLIAQELGASTRSQMMSAVVASTIPMGILQATSTQNDYVVSFWLICFVYFALLHKSKPDLQNTFGLGSCLALSILTKGTAYIYALPFIILFAAIGIKSGREFVTQAILVTILVVGINSGHYIRNYKLWGNPITTDTENLTNDEHGLSMLISNITRNIAMHTGTPIEAINDLNYRAVVKLHNLIGLDLNYYKITAPDIKFEISTRIHEDLTGNLFHILLLFATLILISIRIELRSNTIMLYICALTGGFLLSCLLLKWNPFGSRTQLPLFLLWAPVISIAVSDLMLFANILMSLLLISSIPYLLYNESRPIVTSRYRSIFLSDRTSQYFVSRSQGYKESYINVVEEMKSSGCRDIGVIMGWEGWEYPFWVLMKRDGAPLPRIEHINVQNISSTITTDFSPCATVVIR